jgi:hypothetical protein
VSAWIDKTLNFFRYLLGKSADLRDLDRDDVRLGRIVLDIHRKKSEAELAYLPINDILPIHPIDREEAIATMMERASTVATRRRGTGCLEMPPLPSLPMNRCTHHD